jgi:hypothetical protein
MAHMPFSQLMRDSVIVRKKDGATSGPHKCSVQGNKIYIMDASVDVEEGDSVERELPNGKIESYTVLEAEFTKGLHAIPDSWQLHVRKIGSLKPSGGRTTNIHIANANAIQIGDHNIQQISSVLQSLVHSIDASQTSPEQKQEAKSRLREFLEHPAVTATLGATAGAMTKSILG